MRTMNWLDAMNASYPLTDSPHTSVKQREFEARAAFYRGWEAATEAAKAEPTEFKGWYCAHCQRGVDASEVTFHEQHTECGRVITDDRPPAAKATGTAGEYDETMLPEGFDDALAAACITAGIPDSQYEALCLALTELLTSAPEAARQPAPVAVKPWEDRYAEDRYARQNHETKEFHLLAEVADLRAALAATNRSQP